MKEEQDETGTAQSAEESKTKKYIRIAFGGVLTALVLFAVVMAALRRCGI